MKKAKNLLALTLAVAMLLSTTACNKPSETSASSDSAKSSGSGPVTLTIMHKLNGDEKYFNGDSINNNVWTREYEKELGIKLNYVVAVAGDDYTTKLNTSIASDNLPDLMELPAKQFNQLAQAGDLADLTQSYQKDASDLLKKTLMADGGVQMATGYYQNKLYGIPQPNAADGTCDLLWVRSDWMKKLGLSQPKSLDDVIAMAKAFKNNDPDGDGKNDTIGIGFQKSICDDGGPVNPGSFEGFFAAFGGYSRAWVKGNDGNYEFTGISPNVKNALIKLNEMYKGGLIDPEFGVKDSNALGQDIAAGKCGLFYGSEGAPWGACKDCIVNNPKADWVPYPIVSTTPGQYAKPMTYITLDHYYAVNAKCKHPEALVKIANIFQDKINNIHSTLDTLNTFGVDPKSGFNFCEYSAFGADPSIQKCNTYYSEIKSVYDGKAKLDTIHPEAQRYYTEMKKYSDSKDKKTYPTGWNYFKFIGPEGSWSVIDNVYKANSLELQSAFFGAPTKTMSLKGATLQKMQAETYVKIITGSADPSTFDTFVSNWKQLGGNDISKEVTDWYKQTYKK